jgi:hypothetical protein
MRMWIGSIKLGVRTKDAPDAGTDDLIVARILRDGTDVVGLRLDYSGEDDLERGATRNYVYPVLPRRNHRTPQLPPGIGQNPMPYPSEGIEFSDGLRGHLKVILITSGVDMWVKDNVDFYVKEIRQVATSFDTLAWVKDVDWSYLGTWSQDVALSWDPTEGIPVWTMSLT